MADKVVFPNAIDYVREVNENIVNNMLGGRDAFVLLPSLYERAYALVYETGEVPTIKNIVAPDEATKAQPGVKITTLLT